MKKTSLIVSLVVLFGAVVWSAQALAAGTTDSVHIKVRHKAYVGQSLRVIFWGHDSSPSNVVGTFLDAVLEPPLNRGGSPCRSGLGETEQNHPRSEELLSQKLLDRDHSGHFRFTIFGMPTFRVAGTWRVCAWQYNNDGVTTTYAPASAAQVYISVRRRRPRP